MSDRDLNTGVRQVFGDVPKGTTCRVCGRDVEDGRAKLCSDYCRTIQNNVMSLLNWSGVRREVLERDDHTCQWCGYTTNWVRNGDEHIQAIIDGRMPPQPDVPSITELYEDYSMDEYHDARQPYRAWRRYKYYLKKRFGNPHKRYTDYQLEVDHIVPVSEGGHPFDPANLQTLCGDCHKEKTAAEATGRAEQAERPEMTLMDFQSEDRKPRVENSYQRPPRCPECGEETIIGPKHGAAVVECRECDYRGRFYPIKEQYASQNAP